MERVKQMEDKSIYNKKKTGRETRQKGFGWYGSLNPDAGDVEKNVEMFNNAQPDGGIGAVSPVNGNAMGEAVEEPNQEKPKRYPLYMWKILEDAVAGMNNIPDEHKERFISLVGDRATVKRISGVGYKSALLPISLRKKYNYVNANYNTLVVSPKSFGVTLEQGLTDVYDVMKDKWFKDNLSEATYYTQPDGSWDRDNSAELDAERRERESHKDASKRVKVIDPKDYNRYETGTVGEVFIDRHGDEIYRVKLDNDVQDRYIPFKKDQLKFISEDVNEASEKNKYIYTGPAYHLGRKFERNKPIYVTAHSWGQARTYVVRRIANGDIITNYDIDDSKLQLVSAPDKGNNDMAPEKPKCDNCGTRLTDSGDCPVCDYGEDNLSESIHIDSNLDALSQLNRMEKLYK